MIAAQVFRLGGSLWDVAKILGISRSVARHWVLTIPSFHKACCAPVEDRVRAVEDALYNRAIGYEFEEDKLFVFKDPYTREQEIVSQRVVKHIPPDVRAAEAFLQQHAGWKSTTSSPTTINNNSDPKLPDLSALTDAELEAYAALTEKLENAQAD